MSEGGNVELERGVGLVGGNDGGRKGCSDIRSKSMDRAPRYLHLISQTDLISQTVQKQTVKNSGA